MWAIIFETNLLPKRIDEKKNFTQSLNFDYKITKIVDGDTLKIRRLDGEKVEGVEKEMTVRLLGINTPEFVDSRKPVECFGKEATEYIKSLALGKVAALEYDFSQSKFDDYGRLLAYVYIKDSGIANKNISMLNERMIKEGYAYEYTYNIPYKYKKEFEWLESLAKVNYLGLWSSNTCNGLKTPVAPPQN